MSTGKVHAIATAVTAGVAMPLITTVLNQPDEHALFFAGGCLAGILINPDLDNRRPVYSHAVVRRSAGKAVAWLWQAFWWPYARLIPYHRHWLSHLPLLGTALRLLYLLIFAGLLLWISGQMPLVLAQLTPPLTTHLGWGLAGLAFADALHVLMDRL